MKVPIQHQSTSDVKKQPPRRSKLVRNARYPHKPRPQPPPGVDSLVGRRIVAVRPMTKAELAREGWDEACIAVALDMARCSIPVRTMRATLPARCSGSVADRRLHTGAPVQGGDFGNPYRARFRLATITLHPRR